jgi:type IV secretory pathway VirB10-like protein
MPTASLAAFVVLLGASAAYGLSAGGASNVKDLGVGPKPPAPNTIAQAAPTPPPATTSSAPDTVPQATPTPPPPSSPPAAPKPAKKAKAKKPASTTPSTASTPAASTPSTPSSGATATHQHHTTHHHHATPAPPPSWLADGDPPYGEFNYGAGSKPTKSNDNNTKTGWTTTSAGTGLVIDTGQAQPYNYVGIATSKPGFAVTVYSSNDNKGSGDPSANGWKRVGHASAVAKYQQVAIKLPNNPPRYLLIYVTKLPSGGKASINEVRLVL